MEEREETDLKASDDFKLLSKKASLMVLSEWAVSSQMHLDKRSVRSWRGVSLNKYGENPFIGKLLITSTNATFLNSLFFFLFIYKYSFDCVRKYQTGSGLNTRFAHSALGALGDVKRMLSLKPALYQTADAMFIC